MGIVRQWEFAADMNQNGLVTVTDVWLWIKWGYFWPGDGLIWLAINYTPGLAKFLELSPGKYSGPLSLFLSFPMWVVFLVLFFLTWNLVNSLGARAAEALKRPFQRREEIDPDYRRTSRK
jgi:hypothetical protein